MLKSLLPFLFFTLISAALSGQSDSSVLVKLVSITGYKHIKVQIISRQLSVHDGDVFVNKKALDDALRFSEQILINTGLIRELKFELIELQKNVFVVYLEVKESWNFYPIPYFKTYKLEYRFPYLDKAMKWGVFGKLSFQQWREINYDTRENKQLFYRKPDNSFLSNYFLTEAGLTFRPAFQSVHTFLYGFQRRMVDPVISKNLNPDYLLNGDEKQNFSFLRYSYQFDNRDNRFYPLDGYFFQFEAEKSGLVTKDDRNALTIMGLTDIYKAINPNLSLSVGARGKYSFIRNKQPYYDNRALGFSEFTTMRGYEYYLVDGLDLAMLQTTSRLLLFQGVNNFGKLVFIDAFRVQPYKVYLTLHSDWGIVNNPFSVENINPLDNKLLWSYGVGINIKLYFDMVARIEYSRNIEKGDGIFLNFNASF